MAPRLLIFFRGVNIWEVTQRHFALFIGSPLFLQFSRNISIPISLPNGGNLFELHTDLFARANLLLNFWEVHVAKFCSQTGALQAHTIKAGTMKSIHS